MNNNSVFSQIIKEIRSPKGATYMLVAGIVIAILGCLTFGFDGALLQDTVPGTAANNFGGFLGLIAVLMMLGGFAILVVGFIGLLRQRSSSQTAALGRQSIYPQSASPQELSIEQRREILQRTINTFVSSGYRVVSQTDTTAQLIKPKQFSCLWATLWFLFFGIGILIYLFYYASKRDEQTYLKVDLYGRVTD